MNRRKLLTLLPFLAAPVVLRAETVDWELVELIRKSSVCYCSHISSGVPYVVLHGGNYSFLKEILVDKKNKDNISQICFSKFVHVFETIPAKSKFYSYKEVLKAIDSI